MKPLVMFLKLIRWPNLVFILVTQLLFEYCVLRPLLAKTGAAASIGDYAFILVATAYLLVAAAGYIINDYFDIDIDIVNKPDKVFIDNGISKKMALFLYVAMNVLAIVLGWFASAMLQDNSAIVFITTCVVLLFLYSALLKKQFLVGNLLVAIITASALPVLSCMKMKINWLAPAPGATHQVVLLSWLTYLYTGFAFIISFSREMIKDLEDVEGDKQYGGRTVPIVLGTVASHRIIGGALLILIFTVVYFLLATWQQAIGSSTLTLYTSLLVVIPLAMILWKLFQAKQKTDYHQLSSNIKKVMLAGILSMLFYKFLTI